MSEKHLETTLVAPSVDRGPNHLIEDVAGEEVVLHVGDLHGHGDAVVIGPLLQRSMKKRKLQMLILTGKCQKTRQQGGK